MWPYGRQTERTSEIIRLVGYVAGALPGERLLARLSIAISDDAVLRRARQPPPESPSSLPVATWAWMIGLGAKAKTMERSSSIFTIKKARAVELTEKFERLVRHVERTAPKPQSGEPGGCWLWITDNGDELTRALLCQGRVRVTRAGLHHRGPNWFTTAAR